MIKIYWNYEETSSRERERENLLKTFLSHQKPMRENRTNSRSANSFDCTDKEGCADALLRLGYIGFVGDFESWEMESLNSFRFQCDRSGRLSGVDTKEIALATRHFGRSRNLLHHLTFESPDSRSFIHDQERLKGFPLLN